jgi:hypothetical protein
MRSLYAVQRSDCDALLGVLCNTSEELRLVRRPMSIGTQIKGLDLLRSIQVGFDKCGTAKTHLKKNLQGTMQLRGREQRTK